MRIVLVSGFVIFVLVVFDTFLLVCLVNKVLLYFFALF